MMTRKIMMTSSEMIEAAAEALRISSLTAAAVEKAARARRLHARSQEDDS
jgi:hypothetical protein